MKPYSYWLDTAPALGHLPPIELPRAADVVVVGGGYTGLSAARHLATSGASVVVIERGHVASGASSRNAGQVLTGLRLDASELVDRYGEPRARALFGVSMQALEFLHDLVRTSAIDCDLVRTGHLLAACRPAHFSAMRREQALLARMFQHHVDLVATEGQSAEIGSTKYHGLLIDAQSAAVNPAKLALGLSNDAQRAGARIVCGVTATDAVRAGSSWRIETSHGAIAANELMFATDAYSDRAAGWLQRRLVPVGSFVVTTEPLGAARAADVLPTGRMAFDSRHLLHYFRLTPDSRLLFGGRVAFRASTPDAARDAAHTLRRDAIAIFPQLGDVRLDYAWSGQVAFARDQLPRAGRINGVWYAAGFAGHGIAMAIYLGDRLARRIAGEPVEHPLFDDDWPPIPFYSGRPWFLPIVGAWYRLCDAIGS